MRNFVVPALAAICLSGVAIAPAAAEALPGQLIVKVAHADLDLSTEAGKKELETRISAAVKTACARPAMIRDLKAMQAWESCKSSAEVSASEQFERNLRVASL